MALAPRFIADTSALARLRHPEVSAVLSPLILAGDVATCAVVELEILYSARSYDDLAQTRATRSRAFVQLPVLPTDFERAGQVMAELARRGQHRSVGIPDLLVSAVAEREQVTVIHYDSDYEFVAAVTGQPMQWVVPRGSVP